MANWFSVVQADGEWAVARHVYYCRHQTLKRAEECRGHREAQMGADIPPSRTGCIDRPA